MQGIDWSVVIEYKENFIRGFYTTIELTVVGILFGMLIGLILGLMNISRIKVLTIPAKAYVDLFRGTPLMLQILAIHFGIIPTVCDAMGVDTPSALISGFIALSLNAGAYISEIFRGGILSIHKGQMEAARSLGMTYWQAMRLVILPQAFKRMLPPLGNEFIALMKDSSLVMVIAVNDITYAAMTTAKSTWERLAPYATAALMYLVLTYLLSRVVFYLERRFDTGRKEG
ncbi:amino acid ABC transporter membrane protein (PAAT family) [Planifilum fimeticola]|jgi:polar amino acid transport system permease protein|uniref:Amino acid ABC transporter membrane protein (PAAT family) n=1 Tax=Planifilum fimeticola TaxID=201975 RepID=A0A2T0LA26_9BACL|nr:amino acid ABC transporter permease [Planifilum fimeticola]PRX38599.1 amino acid ABC transporter membrane protein (PAAT family) [Planifilum fimeticola]